jgi:hypothetical protein
MISSHPRLGAVGAVAIGAALLSSAATAAPPSSFAESRGYQNCVAAAGGAVRLLRVDANYFIHDHADARNFYLNGYARRAGRTQPVKIACQMTPSGNRILDVSVDVGRYAGRLVDGVNIARN